MLQRAEDKSTRPEFSKQLDDACSAPAALKLKIGAQVGTTLARVSNWGSISIAGTTVS